MNQIWFSPIFHFFFHHQNFLYALNVLNFFPRLSDLWSFFLLVVWYQIAHCPRELANESPGKKLIFNSKIISILWMMLNDSRKFISVKNLKFQQFPITLSNTLKIFDFDALDHTTENINTAKKDSCSNHDSKFWNVSFSEWWHEGFWFIIHCFFEKVKFKNANTFFWNKIDH